MKIKEVEKWMQKQQQMLLPKSGIFFSEAGYSAISSIATGQHTMMSIGVADAVAKSSIRQLCKR